MNDSARDDDPDRPPLDPDQEQPDPDRPDPRDLERALVSSVEDLLRREAPYEPPDPAVLAEHSLLLGIGFLGFDDLDKAAEWFANAERHGHPDAARAHADTVRLRDALVEMELAALTNGMTWDPLPMLSDLRLPQASETDRRIWLDTLHDLADTVAAGSERIRQTLAAAQEQADAILAEGRRLAGAPTEPGGDAS